MSSRRDFLRTLAAAPVALSLPALAAANASNRLLVMVFLYGGNDGYNTWVPYTDSLYYKLRPTIAVPKDAVLKLTPTHGLHPSLASFGTVALPFSISLKAILWNLSLSV